MPSVPAPPTGATTIVLNWHWACSDAPPPLDIAGATVCSSCNIAISVRIASPGDGGDVTQAIAATTAAAARNVADTIQAAFRTALPPVATEAAEVAAPALPLAAAQAPATYRVDDGAVSVAIDLALSEDLPRHGAPTSFGGGGGGAAQPPVRQRAEGRTRIATFLAVHSRVVAVQHWTLRQTTVTGHATAGPVRPRASEPRGPVLPDPAPSAPTPVILSAAAPATHASGIGVVTALAAGLALTLLYALFTALRVPPVVPPARDAGANPHPPG